jgi:hypothetical protein
VIGIETFRKVKSKGDFGLPGKRSATWQTDAR